MKKSIATLKESGNSPPLTSHQMAGPKGLIVGLGLASLSGVLWFTACPDFDIWPFAWIAMIPALLAIERAPTTRRTALFSWWAGLVGNAGGFYWMIALLTRFANLPWGVAVLLYLLLCAYQALVFLLFGWATRSIRRTIDLPMAFVAPVVMVTFELCVPFIFPYHLAITQAWQTPVIQIADLTGPLGVTALLMMINGAIYDILTERRRRLIVASASLTVLVAVLSYGHLRINQVINQRASAPRIKVGIVQPNVAQERKVLANSSLAKEQLAEMQFRSAELEAAGAGLIVWPETSYPFLISRRAIDDWREWHPGRIRRGFTTPLLMGAVTYDPASRDGYPYNTALMLDRDSRFTASFDKVFLVIFSEYIPGLETFPRIRKFLPKAAGHYARGNDIVTFPFKTADGREWRLGPMICYEDILPSFGRKLARMHPHLLVNITNDAWFGDTSEPWQHLALSVYRCVELRIELIRSVNTGVSAHVDATGKILAKTYVIDPAREPRSADKLLAEVALIEGGHTIYANVGDLFGYMNAVATLYLWLILPRLRRRHDGSLSGEFIHGWRIYRKRIRAS